ncbi:hypothetical protein KR51_00033960 [Rubidibacter lacunae KORDI 51-2]|uniref:Uncharacterized protein n=1 Tax=Rubidibacter lacunae KORDI 51-2 TaxID=582515 RepID=U5DHP0_9CHRO|nr:hypothetical protein [Rubidibacter lacunae]ERN40109.1 hypothetical protein KR51_00033960 [Rubidibacter lacunae KORDI 51-2]
MFTIDLTLKYSPLPLSVQRKEQEGAEALYQQITAAMRGEPTLLELTCEKDDGKKIAVFSDQISGVILSQKTGAAAAGRAPGFFTPTDDRT